MDTSADSHSTQYIQLSPENAVHFLISLLRSNNTKHFCIQNNPMLTLTYTNNRATISVTLLRATSFPGLLTHGTGMMLPGTASISLTWWPPFSCPGVRAQWSPAGAPGTPVCSSSDVAWSDCRDTMQDRDWYCGFSMHPPPSGITRRFQRPLVPVQRGSVQERECTRKGVYKKGSVQRGSVQEGGVYRGGV